MALRPDKAALSTEGFVRLAPGFNPGSCKIGLFHTSFRRDLKNPDIDYERREITRKKNSSSPFSVFRVFRSFMIIECGFLTPFLDSDMKGVDDAVIRTRRT